MKRLWPWFVLAIPLRLLTVGISPIHEFMHVLLAFFQGQEVTSFTWDCVTIRGATDITMTGAYFMELLFYLFFAVRLRPSRFSMFCFGVAHALILRAPGSMDFADYPAATAGFIAVWLIGVAAVWVVVCYRLASVLAEQNPEQPVTIRAPLRR